MHCSKRTSGPWSNWFNILILLQNERNFRILLKYKLINGNQTIKEYFENYPKIATYISPDVQNEIISIINSLTVKKFVDKKNRSKCFTILADETTDIAWVEKFFMCVRYFDKDTEKLRKNFIVNLFMSQIWLEIIWHKFY